MRVSWHLFIYDETTSSSRLASYVYNETEEADSSNDMMHLLLYAEDELLESRDVWVSEIYWREVYAVNSEQGVF